MKLFTLVPSVVFVLAACSQEPVSSGSSAALPKSTLPDRYHLAAEPADARDVALAKTEAKDGESIVVRGRVQDFVAGRAAFVITDGALKSCDEEGPMPTCPTPWDYCCTDPAEVHAASALVELRDGAGVVAADARGFHGLDHLKWVTVKGVAKTDGQGNVTVVADGVYVRP